MNATGRRYFVRRRFIGVGGEKRREYALSRRDTTPVYAGPFIPAHCRWCASGDSHSMALHSAAVEGGRDERH
jgi:hypothetical protein